MRQLKFFTITQSHFGMGFIMTSSWRNLKFDSGPVSHKYQRLSNFRRLEKYKLREKSQAHEYYNVSKSQYIFFSEKLVPGGDATNWQ